MEAHGEITGNWEDAGQEIRAGGVRRSCDPVSGLITADKRLIHTRSYTDRAVLRPGNAVAADGTLGLLCRLPACNRADRDKLQPQSHPESHVPLCVNP